jgi:predicted peroxiredoxin
MDVEKVLVIMTSGPDTPHRCATPIFFANLAEAMGYEAYMFFTIDGTLLLKKGVADKVFPKPGGKSDGGFLKDAIQAGVKIYACSASMDLNDIKEEDLIKEAQVVGGATMWELAENCKTVITL